MRCPKCNGEMRTFDRLGIHVEQCQSCRGIFLDYGELEQIVSAEQQHYTPAEPPPLQQPGVPGAPAAPTAPMPPPAQPVGPAAGHGYHRPDSPSPYYGRPDSPGPYGYGKGQYGQRRKKKSIFEQLFD